MNARAPNPNVPPLSPEMDAFVDDALHSALAHAAPPGPFDLATLTRLLMARALPALSESELQWIAGQSGELARRMANESATVMEAVGCLLAGDNAKHGMGNFRGQNDAPALALHAAAMFTELEALINVDIDACFALRERRKTRGGDPR